MYLGNETESRNPYRQMLTKPWGGLFKGKATDFSSRHLALFQLHTQLKKHPEEIDDEVICGVQAVLLEQAFDHQRQGYFLYREAADVLSACVLISPARETARKAMDALTEALVKTKGAAHRAATEALGRFPVELKGFGPIERRPAAIPGIKWGDLLRRAGISYEGRHTFIGRSLVAHCAKQERILVCKMAQTGDDPSSLLRECLWMEQLKSLSGAFPLRFDIPEPLKVKDAFVFRLTGMPPAIESEKKLNRAVYAIGFLADKDYFRYPNDVDPGKRLDNGRFVETMTLCAWILGWLTSMGIIHDALIPLFHNRTQRGRRSDEGVYQWVRAGRLDRWLYSCEYPNIGLSGVRDFEHFSAFKGQHPDLYRNIGDHFLGLLLVTGSHFRNREPGLSGLDAPGHPVDARHLFEKEVLKKAVVGIFSGYYDGFVGAGFTGTTPFDPDFLSSRMIDEMGVDHYMEELVRVADQESMTDGEFRMFLTDRGIPADKIDTLERGIEDIVIESGPHLGAFNSTISIPELLESVGSMAALCVAGKYWKSRLAVGL